MSKINISFNDKIIEVDEQSLHEAKQTIAQVLSSTMNGTGAVINFGGINYNIDLTKLSAAEDIFAAYLDSIGEEIVEDGELEGSGSEFYTLAPTALTFRSTEPLSEFSEVQINGVTVDPSNYTLEEGSTIVTLPIDYLKTLNVGSYEVAVVSANKAPKGNFSVKAPELNEHGFYYNQPYTAWVDMLSAKLVFFVRNDGTADTIFPEYGNTETVTYVIDGDNVVFTSSTGDYHCTISADGSEIYCNEFATTFVLDDESVVADEDYIYIYIESLGGYVVQVIDKTKSEYAPIRTGINGMQTVALAAVAFENNVNLITAPELPDSLLAIYDEAFDGCENLTSVTISANITTIGYSVFSNCTSLTRIAFNGTMAQWNTVTKCDGWNYRVPATYVQCTDGTVAL